MADTDKKNVFSDLDELDGLDKITTNNVNSVFSHSEDSFDTDAFDNDGDSENDYINDDSLSDDPNDIIQDIRDTIEEIKDKSVSDIESASSSDMEIYDANLKALRDKLDQMIETRGLDDPEQFLLGNVRKNISEIELLIEDLLVFMTSSNKSPTPGVLRTISELINSKTSSLDLLAKFLNNKEKLKIEQQKADAISGSTGHSYVSDDSSLNEQIDSYFEEKNIKMGNELDDMDENSIIGQALSVKKIDNGTAPTVDTLKKQHDELSALEEDDFDE